MIELPPDVSNLLMTTSELVSAAGENSKYFIFFNEFSKCSRVVISAAGENFEYYLFKTILVSGL